MPRLHKNFCLCYQQHHCVANLEGDARAQLNLAARRGGFADGAELRGVHETVGRAQIGVVEGVEKFGAELEFCPLGKFERACEREIQSLHAGAVNGVAADISESEGGGSREGSWVKPLRGSARARGKNRLAGEVGANRIFAEDGAGVGGIAENGNSEGESALDLVDRGEIPIAGERVEQALAGDGRNIVDEASGEAMTDIASEAFFGGEIRIVLRDRGFEHRGAEIGSVAEALRVGVVGEQA